MPLNTGRVKAVGRWAIYFLCASFAAALTRHSLPAQLTWTDSAQTVVDRFGPSDPASYVKYGRHLLRPIPHQDPTNCWPPGVGSINALIFALTGEQAYVLKTTLVSVFLWSLALFFVGQSLFALAWWKSALLLNAVWIFPSFRNWMLTTGAIYSESKATPFFLIACAFLVLGLRSRKAKHFVIAGLSLACATYMRAVFDAFAMGTLLVWIGLIYFSYWHKRSPLDVLLRSPLRFFLLPHDSAERGWLKLVVLFGITYLALITPWKIRNSIVLRSFSLTTCQNGAYIQAWLPDEKLPGFLISLNAPCHADPVLCAFLNQDISKLTPSLARRLEIATLIGKPLPFLWQKIKHFPDFWVGSGERTALQWLEGLLWFGFGLWTLLLSGRHLFRRGELQPVQAWAWVVWGFFAQNILIFTIFFYEYRYSMPIRLFCVFSPFWLFGLAQLSRKVSQ